MGTEIIKWGGGHKLSLPRPEAVLGRGKMWINTQPRIQEDDSSVSVYLKIIRMKGLKGAPSFQLGCFSDINLGNEPNGCSSIQVLFHLLAHWILKTSSKSWQMRRMHLGYVCKVTQPEQAKGLPDSSPSSPWHPFSHCREAPVMAAQ